MSGKFLQPVILLFILAITAIMALQAYWIRTSFIESGKAFDRNVSESLSEVVRKLEKEETRTMLTHRILKSNKNLMPQHPVHPEAPERPLQPRHEHVSVGMTDHPEFIVDYGDTLVRIKDDSNQILWKSEKNARTKIIVKSAKSEKHKLNKELEKIRIVSDSIINSANKADLIEEILSEFTYIGADILKRADPQTLDSLCHAELESRGLHLNYNLAVISGSKDDTLYTIINSLKQVDSTQIFQAVLFPSDLLPGKTKIHLSFPDKQNFIYHELRFTFLSSLAITLLLLFSFMYTINVMMKQRKLDELKNDFINNLAHEFKTPVSTILIASDALITDEVSQNKERVVQLGNIIKQENERVSTQIERVLDLNRLESGSTGIIKKENDLNEIVWDAVNAFALQFEKAGAKIETQYTSEKVLFDCDKLHLSNAIMNLLDNACKYGGQGVNIRIETILENANFIIRVSDDGLGMNKEMSSKIFDKFFRIPTGNVHNIKGFGLGLTYVRTIAKLHGGEVTLNCDSVSGTTFSIILPSNNSTL